MGTENRNNQIRKLRNGGTSRGKVAIMFGLSPTTISQIHHGRAPKKPLPNVIEIMWNGHIKRLLRRY